MPTTRIVNMGSRMSRLDKADTDMIHLVLNDIFSFRVQIPRGSNTLALPLTGWRHALVRVDFVA